MQDLKSQLFGRIEAWSQKFDIPIATMRDRLKDVPFVETRLRDDRPSEPAYLEDDVLRVCGDLLAPDTTSDE
jgi:hypothetical protein